MNRGHGLKLSLLVALGLPLACGGTTSRLPVDGDDSANGGGGASPRGGDGPTPGNPVTGGAATTNGGTGTTPGRPAAPSCTSPQLDPSNGLVSCAEGFSHRPLPQACEVVGGAAADDGGAGAGGESTSGSKPRATGDVECSDDSECSAYELGYCDDSEPSPGCLSGCLIDADCGGGSICVCRAGSNHGGECRPSNCHTDQDCGKTSLCASYDDFCGPGGFACTSPMDECVSTADCGEEGICTWMTVPAGGGTNLAFTKRICDSAVCGRPFLVESNVRRADAVEGSAWLDLTAALPHVAQLTDAERRARAEHWTRLGQMEHASIAAFARFSLQLLSLGAPPELVEACTAALGDETAHAKLCFTLASAYAGRGVGPGPLDISRSLEPMTLDQIVDLVIAEGCFGETSAALEALEAADCATDPVIAAAYTRIARDEQRHAELAFRFVRWALEQDAAVAERLHDALVSGPAASPAVRDVVESCLYGVLARRHAA